MSDVVREMKKKAGFDVEEEEPQPQQRPTSTQRKNSRKSSQKPQEDEGLGSIFGKMGIDLGNLGGLAESVLKTIGLAGKSI